jgi:hypothetical protein
MLEHDDDGQENRHVYISTMMRHEHDGGPENIHMYMNTMMEMMDMNMMVDKKTYTLT